MVKVNHVRQYIKDPCCAQYNHNDNRNHQERIATSLLQYTTWVNTEEERKEQRKNQTNKNREERKNQEKK